MKLIRAGSLDERAGTLRFGALQGGWRRIRSSIRAERLVPSDLTGLGRKSIERGAQKSAANLLVERDQASI